MLYLDHRSRVVALAVEAVKPEDSALNYVRKCSEVLFELVGQTVEDYIMLNLMDSQHRSGICPNPSKILKASQKFLSVGTSLVGVDTLPSAVILYAALACHLWITNDHARSGLLYPASSQRRHLYSKYNKSVCSRWYCDRRDLNMFPLGYGYEDGPTVHDRRWLRRRKCLLH